jgi:hypothetical protein
VNLARAIYNGKCFLAHKKIAAEAAATTAESSPRKLVAGAGFEPAAFRL